MKIVNLTLLFQIEQFAAKKYNLNLHTHEKKIRQSVEYIFLYYNFDNKYYLQICTSSFFMTEVDQGRCPTRLRQAPH